MISKTFQSVKDLPETKGIYSLLDKKNQSLFVGISENHKKSIEQIIRKHKLLESETKQIEIIDDSETELIKLFAGTIRRQNPIYNFSLKNQRLYPHLKITNEEFPRLLATRRIEDDDAVYFGAFLPKTGARFLLGFLIDTFRLRGCDIAINGNFPVPCPQFYRRKCLAPCVKSLCDRGNYLEAAELLRLFLENKIESLDELLLETIETFSAVLNFEKAAKWRDLRFKINNFLKDEKNQFDLNNTSDSWNINFGDGEVLINLVTQRKRRVLGRHAFTFENKGNFSEKEILSQILWQFYQFHTPKEIFVSIDFPTRQFLEEVLTSRSECLVKIKVVKKTNQKKTTKRAFRRAELEQELENIKPQISLKEIQSELKRKFYLKKIPKRIEAFDVAHISGTDFVGAMSVWEAGKFLMEEYKFWFLDEKNELDAISKTFEKRFLAKEKLPNLILIDGSKSQLNSVLKSVDKIENFDSFILSAVKPPQKHNEISHFLLEKGQSIQFNKNSRAFQILLKLRDEAHQLANYVHRTKREMRHFYETYQVLPFLIENERYQLVQKFGSLNQLKKAKETELIESLGEEKGTLIYRALQKENDKKDLFIVPIKYDDPNGEASDLHPLYLTKKS